MTKTESDRDTMIDIAQELFRLGEEATEGHMTRETLRDRLWAVSGRLRPGDQGDQVRRVGVVVFCEVKARTDRDAGNVAEMALRQELPEGTVVAVRTMRDEPWPCRIGDVIEVGMASGNRYTRTQVTSKAWTQRGDEMWDGAMPS